VIKRLERNDAGLPHRRGEIAFDANTALAIGHHFHLRDESGNGENTGMTRERRALVLAGDKLQLRTLGWKIGNNKRVAPRQLLFHAFLFQAGTSRGSGKPTELLSISPAFAPASLFSACRT